MLLYLTEALREIHSGFNVFGYLTMRSILSALTALAISLLVGPTMIERLSYYQIGQNVRSDGPSTHFDKAGTPTMGGALILVAVGVSTLLWASLSNRFVWIVLGLTIAFGLIGFIDDYRKARPARQQGPLGAVEVPAAVARRTRRRLRALSQRAAPGSGDRRCMCPSSRP
jgi:phospho-N-acetylmuramoyl-pentapeptide-transferase